MTVTTELFLPTTPTGNNGSRASKVDQESQSSVKNDPHRFKKHLDQKTNQRTHSPSKDTDQNAPVKKSSGRKVSNSSIPNTKAENAHPAKTDQAAQNDLDNNQDIEIPATHSNGSNPQIPEETEIDKAGLHVSFNGQQAAQNASPPAEPTEQNDSEKALVKRETPTAPVSTQNKNTSDIIQNTETDVTNAKGHHNMLTGQTKNTRQENSANLQDSDSFQAASGNKAPNKNAPPAATAEQKMPDLHSEANNNTNTAGLNIADTATDSLQEPVQGPNASPQQTAIAQSAIQQETSKETKDSAKDFDTKKSPKGNAIAAADGNRQSARSDNAKASSQNSTEDKKSSNVTSSKASSTDSSTASLSAKSSFSTNLTQTMASGEGKVGQPIIQQLPAGLLSVQEVGQNTSLNNGLTATGKIIPNPADINPQMVTKQINIAISKQMDNGQQSFKISLKPAELGQVDIRMDFHTEGKITATVTVENERTLSLLQRDQGSLEKTLENAGFDVNSNNLNFTLKKQQQNNNQADTANNDHDENGESDMMSPLPGSIMSQQQMKMAYSDNILDINI